MNKKTIAIGLAIIATIIIAGISTHRPKKCVTEVIDGDTVELKSGERVRIENIDTPEMHYHSKKEAEEGAIEAREETEAVLEHNCFVFIQGKSIATHKSKDQYGRLIGDFILPNGEEFSDYMLRYNLAEPF